MSGGRGTIQINEMTETERIELLLLVEQAEHQLEMAISGVVYDPSWCHRQHLSHKSRDEAVRQALFAVCRIKELLVAMKTT